MGELPNASLPQSYHGDRITPEQASPFSSPSAHPNSNGQPLSNTRLVVVHALLLCPSTGLYFFFGWEQARQHHVSTSQTTLAVGVGGRIAV